MTTLISNRKASIGSTEFPDDKIENILEYITLNHPRNPYTHFCMSEAEKFKEKNKNIHFDFQKFSKECGKQWAKMDDSQKVKFNELFERDKKEYKKSIELVRHYLFKDYNEVVRHPPTAYRIFLNEKMIEGFEEDKDPKIVKQEASAEWRQMDPETKKIYLERKKENDDWFEKAKHIKKIGPVCLFVQKKIQSAKEKNRNIPKMEEIGRQWKELKPSEKKKYIKYAEEINEEREKLKDIYELINGIKPKKPAGAFRIFLQEKAKEKALNNLDQGRELWNNLSEEEKEEYLKKSHICVLAYKYKKMIYNKKIKKLLPKRPGTAFMFFLKEKKGIKAPEGERWISYWRSVYEGLSENQIKKYEEKVQIAKKKYDKKMEQFNNLVFDIPKKPLSTFNLYIKDNLNKLKEKNKNLGIPEIIKIASENWAKEDEATQKKYQKISESDKKRFSAQMKQFEKLGYYTKNISKNVSKTIDTKNESFDSDTENSEKNDSIKKKRSTKKSVSTKKNRRSNKKTKSRTKSSKKYNLSKSRTKKGKTQRK